MIRRTERMQFHVKSTVITTAQKTVIDGQSISLQPLINNVLVIADIEEIPGASLLLLPGNVEGVAGYADLGAAAAHLKSDV